MKLCNIYRTFDVRYHSKEAPSLYALLNEYHPELLELNNITSFSDLTLSTTYTQMLLNFSGIISVTATWCAVGFVDNLRKSFEASPEFLISRQCWGVKGVIENGVCL